MCKLSPTFRDRSWSDHT